MNGEKQMGFYFDDSESAAAVCGNSPESVIRLLAGRYMKDHPPVPFVWRTWNETGIRSDRKARYIFDFGSRFPDAEIGTAAYACGDLFCPAAKESRFVVTCSCPVVLWLNGDQVFRSSGALERDETPCTVPVSLREGFNRFLLRCERTEIGFSCTLQNAMPQWEPCNYILPFSERMGEAGFLYTEPVSSDAVPAPGIWGDLEAESGFRWLPAREEERDEPGMFYAWTSWELPAGTAVPSLSPEMVLLDRKSPAETMPPAPGRHEVLFFGTLPAIRLAVSRLPGQTFTPFPVKGLCGSILVLGPCEKKSEAPSGMLLPGFLYEGKTWMPDRKHMALRPYVESALFGRWTYPLGVTLYGLLSAGRQLGEQAYIDYVFSHVRQVTGIHAYALWDRARWGFPGVNQQLCWLDSLDDCGSFASLMLECDPEGSDPASRAIALRIGQYMLEEQPRTPEGAFCRRDDTVWADDMYMSGPFLCRYARMTGNRKAMDDYAAQQLRYRRLLYLPQKKIMAHMMCLRHGKNNGIPWSRGNGWVIFSLSELLMVLPENHPDHDALLRHFIDLTEGYLALQDEHGLWHQILDEPDTYPESSATAMFVCAFSRGVRLGWYPEGLSARAEASAERAWHGLAEYTADRNGNLYGVCQGSGFSFSRAYYRTLGWRYNDTHGIGIVMLAGVERMKAKCVP